MGRRVLPAEADPVVFGCTQITSRNMSCQDIFLRRTWKVTVLLTSHPGRAWMIRISRRALRRKIVYAGVSPRPALTA